MQVVNVIERCKDRAQQERSLNSVVGLMIHRCGVDLRHDVVLGYDAPTIVDAFTGKEPRWASVAAVTGRQNPYTIYIGGNLGPEDCDGVVWQALPLDEIGHHGRRFSRGHIGIGVIGDFREKPPSKTQLRTLVSVCSDLCIGLGLDPYKAIKGHGEIEGSHDGTKSPGRHNACPGDLLNMFTLRDDVAQARTRTNYRGLKEAGFVLDEPLP